MSPVRFELAHQAAPFGGRATRPLETTQCHHPHVLRHEIGRNTTTVPACIPCLSVIVPARNEAPSLSQLIREIVEVLRPLCQENSYGSKTLPGGFEVIIVNDGSTDQTAATLITLTKTTPELKVIHLQRSVGQSAATAAGLYEARGDWIATLDADLQNDPADLVKLWNAIPGYDAALGFRTHRVDSWSKRIISHLANRIRNRLLGQSIQDTGCSVRVFPRLLALQLPLFHGFHRFWGPLLLRAGCQIIEVPVRHRARAHGRSHYTLLNRSVKVLVDLFGVAWLMQRPLRFEVRPENSVDAFSTLRSRQLPAAPQKSRQEIG